MPDIRARTDMEKPEENVATNLHRPEPRARQQFEAAPGEVIFDLRNLSIWYNAFKAVTDVTMAVHTREITAFIGSSGSGKTSVLRAFNRMNDLVPGARVDGEIDYHGESLYAPEVSPTAVRRRIGMVFQKPNPFPKSIYDNVAYGPRINGERNKARLNEIVERALRQAALWDEVKNRLNMSGQSLSGGQAQRLCSDRTAFFSVLADKQSDTRTGVLVEYGPTEQIFQDPQDSRTQAYVTGRVG